MRSGRGMARGAALAAALLAGCGFGPGPSSSGTATLTVTRDYGTDRMLEASDSDPSESETVIRMLDRSAEITTRYGGGFVQSIDGVAGATSGGRSSDWFFYVNGVESPVGAADVRVKGGDRIWWDYRDWTGAMRVPAVVGSWPQPFSRTTTSGGRAEVECRGAGRACKGAVDALRAAGVAVATARGSRDAASKSPRILVGPWARVRDDPAIDGLRGGPAANGVFARFSGRRGGDDHLVALDRTAASARDLGSGAGLVAALHDGDGPVTWLVTGARKPAVNVAAAALDDRSLRNRYAVAALGGGRTVPLPVTGGAG